MFSLTFRDATKVKPKAGLMHRSRSFRIRNAVPHHHLNDKSDFVGGDDEGCLARHAARIFGGCFATILYH